MPKGIPNKRNTPEFKQQVVEAVMQDGLSYKEAARLYDVQGHGRIQSWQRDLFVRRFGRACRRASRAQKYGKAEETAKQSGRGFARRSSAVACGRCLLKKLASLGFGRRATPAQKAQVVQELRQEFSLSLLLEIAQLPRTTFYYHLKQHEGTGQIQGSQSRNYR